MVERIHQSKAPRLFIKEWMETVPGLDQRRLAQRMGRTDSVISKKLKAPEKIDAEWLAAFANALDLEVVDLFRDPNAPTPAELLKGLSPKQASEVISFASYVRQRDGTTG